MSGQGNAHDLGFVHRFVPATAERTPLLLLHGTGGDEHDLIPLGQRLAPGTALLSPRGKVLENGMPRFFRRIAEGVFDLEDLRMRTDELARFVDAARAAYGLGKPVALGFSNGANIAASLLLAHPGILSGAILMRAMLPYRPQTIPRLSGFPVLVLSGNADPLIPADQRDRLAAILRSAGADLRYEVLDAGHGLTQPDLAIAAEWLAQR